MRMLRLLLLVLLLPGCSSDIANRRATIETRSRPVRWQASAGCLSTVPVAPGATRDSLAQECLGRQRERERDFIAVTLSGGGTKAAVFSAETLFYLDALGLLQRTSVVSSVSGGSFPAALYALSCDPGDVAGNAACRSENTRGLRRPVWHHPEILRTAGQGYAPLVTEQVARWLVPLVPGTISAGGFARFIDTNFFGTGSATGERFQFSDLNPRRPHLVLNSAIVSANRGGIGSSGPGTLGCAGDPPVPRGWLRRRDPDEFFHFAYTDLYFGLLRSRLDTFPVAGAVAASAAFPVLIDHAQLTDFCRADTDTDRTLQLMDGGANDNQGMVEVYHVLTEIVLGQHRSDVPPAELERMGPRNTAYVFVVNSSVSDSTGPTGSGSGSGPLGLVGWISNVVANVQTGVDVYSATSFNLRKNFYASEARRVVQLPGTARIRPVEIGLDGLDQYGRGGAQAALWDKAGLLRAPDAGERTDPALAEVQQRAVLQRAALGRVLPAAARRHLRLSSYHPQCYFDIRARFDASLVSLGADEQACLRDAARWAVALRAQELCELSAGPRGERAPDGLDCRGGLVSLPRAEVLGTAGDGGGSCPAILDQLIANRDATAARDPEACRALPPD